MTHSNFIQRLPGASPWPFVVGMSALSCCLMVLIYFLLKNYPGALYETLNLYLQDPNVDRLVMKVETLEHEVETLEHEVAELTAEVQAAKHYIKDIHIAILPPVALGVTVGISLAIFLKYVAFCLG
jgi:hypothetical protein